MANNTFSLSSSATADREHSDAVLSSSLPSDRSRSMSPAMSSTPSSAASSQCHSCEACRRAEAADKAAADLAAPAAADDATGGPVCIPGVSPRFEALVQALKQALGPSSGLTSDDVDVAHLTRLMADYDAKDEGWMPYNFGDASRGYTRNLVDEGNGKSNLLLLVWSPGKGSPIHDHGNAHCLMKILRGELTETRFAFPEAEGRAMTITSERTYPENAVAYMADELGVHKIWNKGSDFAVSLHLYTPPNVAKGGCNMFNEKTGKTSHVSKCGYYTAYGQMVRDM